MPSPSVHPADAAVVDAVVDAVDASPVDADPPPLVLAEVDVARRYVRVIERNAAAGLVAFEFSVGWPDMAVELVLPAPLFEGFCERHGAERLPDALRSPGLQAHAPVDPIDPPDDLDVPDPLEPTGDR